MILKFFKTKQKMQKTIKPVSIGGIAGGEKFIANGILFKFAVDFEGLYQVRLNHFSIFIFHFLKFQKKGDENAMKAASHDLKGLAAYMHTGLNALHVPLMALVDFNGFVSFFLNFGLF